MAKFDEILSVVIQLLDIKKLIVSVFAGIITLLLLPTNFCIKQLVDLKLRSNQDTVQIILYITFWYIVFMATPIIKKYAIKLFIIIKRKFEFYQFMKMRIFKLTDSEQFICEILFECNNKWFDFTEPDGNGRIVNYCIYAIDYESLDELIAQRIVENKFQNSYSSDTPILYCRMNKTVYRYFKHKNRGLII